MAVEVAAVSQANRPRPKLPGVEVSGEGSRFVDEHVGGESTLAMIVWHVRSNMTTTMTRAKRSASARHSMC